jgi:FkbM family methyltransferase
MKPIVKYLPYHICIIDESTKRQIWLAGSSNVYTNDMVISFDYFFSAVVPVNIAGYQIADYSALRWHEIIGFPDHPILCPSLGEVYGTVEQYLDFAKLQPGHTVLDLGGYTGLTSIAFSRAVGPTGRVILLEPDPVNFSACKKNIALHKNISKLNNITLLQSAVSEITGALEFSSESSMGSSAVDFVGKGRGNIVSVPSLTLSDLSKSTGLDHIDFIKMDIEGSELGTIRESHEFLLEYRPKMIIEAHYINGKICDTDLLALLKNCRYDCKLMSQPNVVLPLITAIPL